MEADEKKEFLGRMRAAIKRAKAERTETMADLAEELYQAGAPLEFADDPVDRAEFNRVIQKGKNRNMIDTVKQKLAESAVHTVEIPAVKWREPYEKRPSVRAGKKHRSKSAELSL